MRLGDRIRRAGEAIWRDSVRGRLARLEREIRGSPATYVGNNRVLTRCIVKGWTIAYYVEADDRLLSPWFIVTGRYETELTDYILRAIRPDSRCIDAGANFGYFTCLMARFAPAGRVIGIEADAHVHRLAADNVAINGFAHADVIHAAAGDRDGEMTLFRRQSRSANTSIVEMGEAFTTMLDEAPEQRFTVPAVRLDDVAARLDGRVDIFKIDVEGAEPLVIAGAAALIAANPRIEILMEWSPGQIAAAGFDIPAFLTDLGGLGLRAFDIRGRRPAPLSFDEVANLPYQQAILFRR